MKTTIIAKFHDTLHHCIYAKEICLKNWNSLYILFIYLYIAQISKKWKKILQEMYFINSTSTAASSFLNERMLLRRNWLLNQIKRRCRLKFCLFCCWFWIWNLEYIIINAFWVKRTLATLAREAADIMRPTKFHIQIVPPNKNRKVTKMTKYLAENSWLQEFTLMQIN